MLLPFVDSVVQDLPTSRAQSITLCGLLCTNREKKNVRRILKSCVLISHNKITCKLKKCCINDIFPGKL